MLFNVKKGLIKTVMENEKLSAIIEWERVMKEGGLEMRSGLL
jgi:hypothetical protein